MNDGWKQWKPRDNNDPYLLTFAALATDPESGFRESKDEMVSNVLNECTSNDADVLVQVVNQQIVSGLLLENNEKEDYVTLYYVFVPKEHRKQGYGEELIEKACEIVKEQYHKHVVRVTLAFPGRGARNRRKDPNSQKRLANWYSKIGFKEVRPNPKPKDDWKTMDRVL